MSETTVEMPANSLEVPAMNTPIYDALADELGLTAVEEIPAETTNPKASEGNPSD